MARFWHSRKATVSCALCTTCPVKVRSWWWANNCSLQVGISSTMFWLNITNFDISICMGPTTDTVDHECVRHSEQLVLAGCVLGFVWTCPENLVNRFWCYFNYCLLLWSRCGCFSMKNIGGPFMVFKDGGEVENFEYYVWALKIEQIESCGLHHMVYQIRIVHHVVCKPHDLTSLNWPVSRGKV